MKTTTQPQKRTSYKLRLFATIISIGTSMFTFSATNSISVSGTWENPLNWALGHLPLNTEDVVITGNGIITINSAAVCASLTLGDNMGQAPTLTINGTNSINISGSTTGSGILAMNPNNKNKTYTINVGAGSLTASGIPSFGTSGTSQINVGTGSINFTNANGFSWSNANITLTNNGNVSFTGPITHTSGTIQNTTTAGTVSFNGGLNLNGGTFTTLAAETINIGGDLTITTPALTLDPTSTCIFKAASIITPTSTLTFGNVKINSGINATAAGNLAVTGNWTNNGGTFTPGLFSVTFTGTASQAINGTSVSQAFYVLNISLSAGKTLSVAGSTTSLSAQDINLNSGNFAAGTAATVNINGNLSISSGTYASAANTNLSGNFSNAGTFTASTGNTLTFTSSLTSTITGTGTYTIKNLSINKSSKNTIIEIQSANFVAGINTGNVFNFTFTQGTLKYNTTATLNDCHNSGATGSLTIPFNTIIESNAGVMNLCKSGSMASGTKSNVILSGKLFMNGGTVNMTNAVNSTDVQYKVNGGTPQLYVSSGNLNLNAGFNFNSSTDYIDFNMTGGTITAGMGSTPTNNPTVVMNDVSGGSTYMSGGLIVIQEATNGVFSDIDLGSTNLTSYSVTGGTIQFGNASTGANTIFAFQAHPLSVYPNFVLNAGTAKKVQPLNNADFQLMSLTINSNMTFDIYDYLTNAGTKNMTITSTDGTNAFYNAGTFTQRSSTVIFAGSTNQTVTGSVNTSFNNLTISNAGGVTLGSSQIVVGQLNLNSGLLNTSASNILTLTSTASSTSGSASSFVNGPMIKTGNSAFVFPIGKGNKWARLGISAPATATNQVTAEYFNYVYSGRPVNSTLANVSSIEYWTLSESVTANVLKATLYWESASASGIKTFDNTLRVAHWNGSSWEDVGQSAIVISNQGNITSGNISNFSPFTFGSTDFSKNPLPVNLIDFSARLNAQQTVDLDWITGSETNNDHFTIERSADGHSFESIINVEGAGTTSFRHAYTSIDHAPLNGISYYRLKQTDFDGKFTYSGIVSVELNKASVTFKAYPNPSTGESVHIELSGFGIDSEVLLTLNDISGKQCYSKSLIADAAGTISHVIDNMQSLQKGIYLITIANAGKLLSNKLIVE